MFDHRPRRDGSACRSGALRLIAGVLLVLAAGCTSSVADGAKEADLVAVKTVAVSQQSVRRTSTQPATVHPYHRAEIRARVSGYCEELKADIGDYVEAGGVLAVIATPELLKRCEVLDARVRQLEAEEARGESGVELATARIESAKAQRAEAESDVQRVEANLAAAEAEFERTQDLVGRQSLQARVLDEVRKRRDSELASLESVKSSVRSAAAEVAVAEAMRRSAESDLDAAKAETEVVRRQRDELAVMIDFATLKAPFAGVVTERNVDPGDLVRVAEEAGEGKPLFVVSQVDPVRVRVPVPEVDAAWVSRDDVMTLTFPSFADESPVEAKVTRVAGGLDPSTRSMWVEAELENGEMKWIPGMFGRATISLTDSVAASVLPARAVRFEESGNAYVYIVDEDATVSVTPVTIGSDDGSSIEILAGLRPGQRVIDAHLQRFSDGQKVRPLPHD